MPCFLNSQTKTCSSLCILTLLSFMITPPSSLEAQNRRTKIALEDSIRLAQPYQQKKDWEAALTQMMQTQQRDQRDYHFLIKVAWLHFQLQQYSKASSYYQQASIVHYSAIEPLLGLMQSQLALGQWADARKSARLIASKSTNHYQALMTMAQTNFELGDYKEAAKVYKRIQRLYPSNTQAISGEAWASLAMKQYDRVSTLSLILIKLADSDSTAWSLQGWVALNRNQLSQAENNFLHALQIKSNNTSAMTGLGWVYYKRKIYSHAYARFTRAYKINPNNMEAISGLAWTHYMQGQFDQAAPYMNILAQRRPLDKDVKQAMVFLKNRVKVKNSLSRS